MFFAVRISKVLLCLFLLLNLSQFFWAQTPNVVQSSKETVKTMTNSPVPDAVPIMTQEEAEQAKKDAIAFHETIVREAEALRSKEISHAISQRKIHRFYKSIALLLIVIIHISFIGYFNFFRRRFKIHWTNVMLFGSCLLAVIMMISGMIHVMKPVAYLICIVGFILAVSEVIYVDKKRRIPSLETIQHVFFRPEYVFFLCASIGSFVVFTNIKIEMGWGDVPNAWYHHYLYVVKNGRWSDSGYTNYASAYAMIANGISAYFAFLLHNYGTQLWTWGHIWLSIMMVMPILRIVKWNNVPKYEILIISSCLLYYKIYLKTSLLLYSFIITLGALSVLNAIIHSKKRKEYLNNSIVLFVGIILCVYAVTSPQELFVYPLDNLLGCATIGILFSFAWKIFYFGIFDWHLLLYTIPLAVLTLIKPTGVIPAILLSLYFGFGLLHVFFKRYSFFGSWKHKKPFLVATISFAVIVLSPFVSHISWNYYAELNNLKYQHSISAGAILKEAVSQLKQGYSKEDIIKWQKDIRGINRMPSHFYDKDYKINKSKIEIYIEMICQRFFTKHPLLDFGFSTPKEGISHVAIVSFLLLLTSFFCLSVCKKKVLYFLLVNWALLSYVVFVINQFYLGPMFSSPPVPALFRYFYPAYAIVLGVSCFGIFLLFKQSKSVWGILICIFLFFSLSPHFFSAIPNPTYIDSKQSWIGYILLAQRNPDLEHPYHFANSHAEKYVPKTLSYFVPRFKYSSAVPQKDFIDIVASDTLTAGWKHSPVKKPGLYLAKSNQDTKTINLSPLFCNTDAPALLNEAFYFSDLSSWDCPPWIEKPLFDSERKNWAIPKNNKIVEKDSGDIIVYPLEKKLTLLNTAYHFCFAQDSIRFVGKYSKGMVFSVVFTLYEKSDIDHKVKRIKMIPMNTLTSSINKKENEFNANLNLADIPTDKLNLYYKIGIIFEPGTEGEMHDFHLYQYVSGKLNLEQALAELEQNNQNDQNEPNDHFIQTSQTDQTFEFDLMD